MKVLLLNQFFHPDLAATAQLATDLGEDLVRAGFEVTALAARGAYLGGGRLPGRDEHRGVRIERVRCTSLGKGSIGRRLLDYGTFYGAAALRALTQRRFDVVVAMSTPPLVAAVGALLRRLRGTPFVYWLQDVYPELAVELGVLRARSAAARGFDALSRWTLRSADAVVVLGDAMGDRVRVKGVDPARIEVIPNWADGEAVGPVPSAENPFLRAHGLEGKRVVLYSGNMGRAHDLETVFGAARRLRHREELAFVFVGDGGRRGEVEAAARELPAIRLLPYQPRARLAESLSAGALHLVTQAPFTVGLIEPSKLYGAMAAGRPVVYVGPAETEAARTVSREGIGAVVPNGDAAGAAAAIERVLGEADALGARARAAFEARYSRSLRTAQFTTLLGRLGGRRDDPAHRPDWRTSAP